MFPSFSEFEQGALCDLSMAWCQQMYEGTEAWDSEGPHSRVCKQIVEWGANTNIIWKSFCHQWWVYIYLLFVVIVEA